MREPSKSIPEITYKRLIGYFLTDAPAAAKEVLYNQIKDDLESKLQREIDHDLYTQYKTAPTPEQREKARKEYLDRVGISKDFRW
jgi:hypothetical protein